MDALSCLIDDSSQQDCFEGLKLENFQLTHLTYADDLLVFGKANIKNLELFSNLAGLHLNLHKSTLLISSLANISPSISQALHIHNCSTKISYLGIPISLGRSKISDFSPLIEKVTNLLSDWKAKLLSFAGNWISDGSWSLPPPLSHSIKDTIYAILIAHNCHYHITWDNNENAYFKDFYNEHFSDSDVDWFQLIWHNKYSIRYSSCTWIAINGGLKTVEALRYRNIFIEDTSCPLCLGFLENCSHLLFECDYSFQLITMLIPHFKNFYLRPNIAQALHFIDGLNINRETKNANLLILHAAIYFIWNERNTKKFKGNDVCVTTLYKKISRAIYLKLNK
ncbi:hypothetical protein KFK09_000881 [Dendrobium nobile]|uniref:Reverse transcriptase zinc-binding domain-containing protein n=1 Tax=Dendrobium nobile TaxID=94219 RepID=A0A8T3C9T7_DENNO|nr:hypothetical protein KFK09_000881 [Dendrobium nobile]